MKIILDTHILLWAAGSPEKLTLKAKKMLLDNKNILYFSSASLWEIVIKKGLGRKDFRVDSARLRKMLVSQGYQELSITSEHVLTIESLPALHKDPFDRILIAQARTEGMLLLTADSDLLLYGEGILAA